MRRRAIERGIVTAALGSATLDSVAAAVTAVKLTGAGSVRLWAMGAAESFVFTVGVRGIEAVERCAVTYDAVFQAVQQVFGVGTVHEAMNLFFERPPEPTQQRTSRRWSPADAECLGGVSGAAVSELRVHGLTRGEAWFLPRRSRKRWAWPVWQPNVHRFSILCS